MHRHKGERTSRKIEHEKPHHVVVSLPLGGMGQTLWDIHRLAEFLGGEAGGFVRPNGQRFCFSSREVANDFAKRVREVGIEAS